MDQYKISQNPGSSKQGGAKAKSKKKRVSAPKHRDTQSLSPHLVMGAVVLVLVLVFGGLVWAHYFNKPSSSETAANSNKTASKKGGSGAATTIPEDAVTGVTNAISNNKPADLKVFYAKKVHIIVVRTATNQTVGSAQVESLISNPLNSAQTPWDWHVPPVDLSAWQTGPYGQYFNGNVLVGISADGTVIVVHFDANGQIDSILIVPLADLTTPVPGGGSRGSGSTSGGGSTISPVASPVGGANGSD